MWKSIPAQKLQGHIKLDMRAAELSCVDSIPGRSKWRSLLPHGLGKASTHRIERLKYNIGKIQNKKISTCNRDLFRDALCEQIGALQGYQKELENMEGVASEASETEGQSKPAAPSRWRSLIPGFFKTKGKKEKRRDKKQDIVNLLGSVKSTLALQGLLYDAMREQSEEVPGRKISSKDNLVKCWNLGGTARTSFEDSLDKLTKEDIGAAYRMACTIADEAELAAARCLPQRDWSSIECLVGAGKPYEKKKDAEKEAHDALSKLSIITGVSLAGCDSIAQALDIMARELGWDSLCGTSKSRAVNDFFTARLGLNKELSKKFGSILSSYKEEAVVKDSESSNHYDSLREVSMRSNLPVVSGGGYPAIKDRLDDELSYSFDSDQYYSSDDEMSYSSDSDLYYSCDDEINSSNQKEIRIAEKAEDELEASEKEEEHIEQQLGKELKASEKKEEQIAEELEDELETSEKEEEHIEQQLEKELKASE